ncbi:MAG: ATP-binding protein [Thermoleophilia bacterium]
MQFLERRVARAVRDFDLITEGDRILVGVSGGKDSLVLLEALARRRRWRPENYELLACHVVDGVCGPTCSYASRLGEICAGLDVPLKVITERTVPTLEELETGIRPCWLCSWRRRKVLIKTADAEGCNLIALGHHKDDIAETLLLNLLWQGRHESMLPKQPLFAGRITLIRPLALTDAGAVARLARLREYPLHECPCPYAEDSKRETARQIIRLAREAGVRDVTSNLVRTVFRPDGRREETGAVAVRVAEMSTESEPS